MPRPQGVVRFANRGLGPCQWSSLAACMPLNYKDFFPVVLESGFFSTEHEALPATVARANQWVAESGVRIINVETVVLPNIECVEDASKVGIRTSGEISSHWYQVVRVWYESSKPTA